MNVTEKNQPFTYNDTTYRSIKYEDRMSESACKTAGKESDASAKAADKASERSGSDPRIRSSAPDDSVGQLAAELARSETKMDVLQVLSKATRALANLKMSAYACEGKDAKKVAQMIKRMEKLIKRIQKKAKQLGKEEQMEIQQKKAEKQKELERAKQIREELRSKRNKRRREERDYAAKELATDGKESVNDTLSAIIGAGTALSGSQSTIYNAAGGIDLSAMSSAGGVSLDITV